MVDAEQTLGLRLETRRLILREWLPSDIDDLIEGLNDIRVAKWLAFVPHPYTRRDAERWVEHCASASRQGDDRRDYEFAVELKAEHKVIGGVSIARISRLHGTAGGGIWISSEYQKRGYGTEALGGKIGFAFETLGLRRLENGFFKGNASSFAMQARFGYQLEGEKRKALFCLADGEWKDECITGLLREEWRKNP